VFEHVLAEQLGMTVARLRAEMTAEEFANWARFRAWRDREQRWAQQKAAGRAKAARSAPRPVGAA
jgi:hypothetical protein